MGYCTNCGTYNSDNMAYCVKCQTPLYVGRFGSRIGGFLAFVTYGMGIGAALFGIYSIVFVIQVFKLSSWLGGGLAFFGVLYIILAISLTVWFARTSAMILDKDSDFLGVYQRGLIINSLLLLCIVIWGVAKFRDELGVSLITDVIFFFIGGLLYSVYFSTSERVFVYMGRSDSYLKNSLFNRSSSRYAGRTMDAMAGTGRIARITDEKEIKDILNHGGWKCHKCGAVNKAYIGTCNCGLVREESERLKEKHYQDMKDLIRERQERDQKQQQQQPNNKLNPMAAADAIEKYKQLLDMGAITQQEFESKKKEILASAASNEMPADRQSAGQAEKPAKPEKADDTRDWNCKQCGTLNTGDKKCCRNCGGIKLIVGYTPVEGAREQEVQYTQHTDANGNTYFTDSRGNAFYVDENGNPFYINQKGYPYYLDPQGRPYYHDTNGYIVYYDVNGDPYYPSNM